MSDRLEPPFALTDGERRHPLWLKLAAHCEEKLREMRGRNDGPLTEQETATLRGHIQCLKGILSLGEEPPRLDG